MTGRVAELLVRQVTTRTPVNFCESNVPGFPSMYSLVRQSTYHEMRDTIYNYCRRRAGRV